MGSSSPPKWRGGSSSYARRTGVVDPNLAPTQPSLTETKRRYDWRPNEGIPRSSNYICHFGRFYALKGIHFAYTWTLQSTLENGTPLKNRYDWGPIEPEVRVRVGSRSLEDLGLTATSAEHPPNPPDLVLRGDRWSTVDGRNGRNGLIGKISTERTIPCTHGNQQLKRIWKATL